MRSHFYTSVVLILVVIVFSGLNAPAQIVIATPTPGPPPVTVARNFYTWYIGAVNRGDDIMGHNGADIGRYVTDRLVQKVKELQIKTSSQLPFFPSGQFDATWVDHMDVSELTNDKNFWLWVTFPGVRVRLTFLFQNNKVWKIDSVIDDRASLESPPRPRRPR